MIRYAREGIIRKAAGIRMTTLVPHIVHFLSDSCCQPSPSAFSSCLVMPLNKPTLQPPPPHLCFSLFSSFDSKCNPPHLPSSLCREELPRNPGCSFSPLVSCYVKF